MDTSVEEPRTVLLAAGPGSVLEQSEAVLKAARFAVSRISSPEEIRALPLSEVPDLVIVDQSFGPEGGILFCHSLRESQAFHNVSVIVVIPAGSQHIEECLVSGVNDFLLSPFPDEELLNKARRLTLIPARREVNTLVRVREVRLGGETHLGKTLNVSAGGLLTEVECHLDLGRIVELEFFLPRDPVPLKSRGQVARRADELDVYHAAYGVKFLELSPGDRARIVEFVARKERDRTAKTSGKEPV